MIEPIVTVLQDPDGWLDYLTAFGTVGAAIVPLIFFLIERKGRKAAELARGAAETRRDNAEALQRQRENEYRDAELERLRAAQEAADEKEMRSQAELVHIWAEGTGERSRLHALNSSRIPVSMVIIRVVLTWYPVVDQQVIWDEPMQTDFLHSIPQLGPTGETPREFSLAETDWALLWTAPANHRFGGMAVDHIQFRDTNGLSWTRNPRTDNRLTRFPANDAQEPPGAA